MIHTIKVKKNIINAYFNIYCFCVISILDLFKGTTILILTFNSSEIIYYEMAH